MPKGTIFQEYTAKKYQYRDVNYVIKLRKSPKNYDDIPSWVLTAKNWAPLEEYFCAYFLLNTSKISLDLNKVLDKENVEENVARHLGSSLINKVSEYAHRGFTLSKLITTIDEERDITEIVKLGVDYCHPGDEHEEHTFDSVCEDCETLIDKLYDLKLFEDI